VEGKTIGNPFNLERKKFKWEDTTLVMCKIKVMENTIKENPFTRNVKPSYIKGRENLLHSIVVKS